MKRSCRGLNLKTVPGYFWRKTQKVTMVGTYFNPGLPERETAVLTSSAVTWHRDERECLREVMGE
jgi:hypothetical protein